MAEMKVGDKVKVVACNSLHLFEIGSIVEIACVCDDGVHNFRGNSGNCWYMWTSDYTPIRDTPEVGTLAEIGAQVGDVVEFVEWAGGNRESGMFAVGKQYTHTGDRLDSGRGYFLMANAVKHIFRIVSRASDAKPPVELAMDQGASIAGPVITETVKRIVPGVYGKVSIMVDGDTALIGWDRSHMNKDGIAYGTLHQPMSRDDLTAAIETLTVIRDAL